LFVKLEDKLLTFWNICCKFCAFRNFCNERFI